MQHAASSSNRNGPRRGTGSNPNQDDETNPIRPFFSIKAPYGSQFPPAITRRTGLNI